MPDGLDADLVLAPLRAANSAAGPFRAPDSKSALPFLREFGCEGAD
jgi:hypothetical protein